MKNALSLFAGFVLLMLASVTQAQQAIPAQGLQEVPMHTDTFIPPSAPFPGSKEVVGAGVPVATGTAPGWKDPGPGPLHPPIHPTPVWFTCNGAYRPPGEDLSQPCPTQLPDD
jgi:hypothetical protein